MTSRPLTHWRGEPVDALRALWGVPNLEAYERLGSTNDRARALAVDPGNTFSVVVADEQTEGRGRRGAHWHSPAGSGLWMSVVLPGQASLHVPLLVGLAVAQAVQDIDPEARIGIEWPNDLVAGGRKVGGILCEGSGGAIVAGIGVNVLSPEGGFPAPLEGRATSLEEECGKALPHDALARLIVRGLKSLAASPASRLDPHVLDELKARDALAARAVLTEAHGPGTARGIEPDGALLLERPDGSRVRVLAGSVRPA